MRKQALKQKLKYIVPEYKLVLVKERSKLLQTIMAPEDLEPLLEPMKHLPEEHFVAFHLDTGNRVIGAHVVSHGTISSSLVHPREVFKAAMLSNAFAIIVAHNHPSDSPKPSLDDWKTTEQLVSAGKLLGVPVIDHILVTGNRIISLREERPSVF